MPQITTFHPIETKVSVRVRGPRLEVTIDEPPDESPQKPEKPQTFVLREGQDPPKRGQ